MQKCGSSPGNSFSMMFSLPLDHHEPLSTAVDCTLSLGTPSTRMSSDMEKRRATNRACVTNFCWDLLHEPFQPPSNLPQNGCKIGRGSFIRVNGDGGDPLLARRCANCDTTSTPLWRNGPRGPKSLCNACGIRFKKEERRAAEAESSPTGVADHQRTWVPLSQSKKVPCFSPVIDEDISAGVPFLSWRLNVTDRPSLVHEFTR